MTPTGNTDPIGTVPDDPATWTDRDHAVLIANLRGRIIESEREDHMTDGSMTDERWDQMHRERVRLQAQIDELAAKVEGLDSHHKARLQEHDRIIGKVSDATDKMGNVLNKLTGTDWYAEPAVPKPVGAATRNRVAQWLMDQFDGDQHLSPSGHTIAVRNHPDREQWFKAADELLTLAAPADRAVVVTPQVVIDELIAHARKGLPYVGHDGQPINDLIAEWLEFIAEVITIPKASTDDGMAVLKTFRDAYNDQAREFGVSTSDTHTQGEAMCQAAGAFAVARAVQARLEGQ